MPASKSPRARALQGLKRLSADRVDKKGSIAEIFHWGVFANSARKRDPRQDRSTAIAAATVVEHGLEHAILSLLHRRGAETRDNLFEGDAAILRDFSAKITVAHAMGILGDKSRSDISMIRRIRNTFAHCRHSIDFNTPEIAEACRQLTLWKRLIERDQATAKKDVREEYIHICFEFSVWLFTFDEERPEGASAHPPRAQLQL